MGKTNFEGRESEFDALKDIDGLDPNKIMQQVAGAGAGAGAGNEGNGGAGAGAGGAGGGGSSEGGGAGAGAGAGAAAGAGASKSGEPGSDTAATGILKEIFSDQFTTVEDLKKADIPGKLKELETLRQQNQTLTSERDELTGKLNTKPKHNFVNDDIALYNEFVRHSGIKSFDVFNKIQGAEVANMAYMDALVLQRMIENPELAGQDTRVRKYLEKKYNVDPETVTDPEELAENQIGLAEDGARAKQKLVELKGKLKLPEPDSNDQGGAPKWTPEKESEAKKGWGTVNETMGTTLANIGIPMKGMKEPIVNFIIPEEAKKAMITKAIDYAVSNRMEINQANMTAVAKFMYSEYILQHLDQISHSIFEKARSMTQEEILKVYHNPTPLGGGDHPAGGKGELPDDEAKRQKVLDAEMGRR
jgi:hypothetical protein